jgi:hypothetical protein
MFCFSEPLLDVLRFAADKASDFLEFTFFLFTEGMVGFVIPIELGMSAAKVVICLN